MTNFGLGSYQTKGGHRVVIAQIRSEDKCWTLRGAVEDPISGVLSLARWSVGGHMLNIYEQTDEFDLVLNT